MIEPDATLLQMFLDWQQAIGVAQTAQNDVPLKEAPFKGAAELAHGKDATFKYEDGILTFSQPEAAIASGSDSVN